MLECGAPTHFFPHFPTSPHSSLHLPLPPPYPNTLSYTSSHTSSHISPTFQHIFLLSPHLPSPSQSVAKLPCDEIAEAKLLWRSYHVAKLLATTGYTETVPGVLLGDQVCYLSRHVRVNKKGSFYFIGNFSKFPVFKI